MAWAEDEEEEEEGEEGTAPTYATTKAYLLHNFNLKNHHIHIDGERACFDF